MAKQIKISGDTSEIKKSILDISKTMKSELGKSKIEIFSPDTKKFLKEEASRNADLLAQKMNKIKDTVAEHQKQLAKVNKNSKEELRIKEKILNATKKIAEMDKERGKLQDIAGQLGDPKKGGIFSRIFGGGRGGAMGKGAAAAAGGGIFGRALGLLGRAGPMGLLGAGVAGAGLYGLGRLRSGFRTFESGIGDRMALRGRGVTDMTPEDPNRLARAGMNALTLRQARLRDMDVFGRGGSTQQAVMQRAEFERNFGIQQGTLSGLGGQLRQSLGGRGAEKSVMNIQASLIASGITDEIGPYLETTANMLTQLNERGFTFDQSALSLFNSIVDRNQNIERTQRLISNVDQGIRGSTGEANAFFQTAFGRAGIGGGTIGGAQAGIRTGGLFGFNIGRNKLLEGTADAQAMRAMGIGGETMQKVAGATIGMLDQMFGSEEEIKRQLNDPATKQAAAQKQLSRQRFIMRTFGLADEGQAAEVNQLLREAANPATSAKRQEDIQKKLQNLKKGNTELGNLQAINKSTAGSLDVLKNLRTTVEDAMGQKVAPAVLTMRDTLLSIDRAILKLLDTFGIDTTEENKAEALAGKDTLSQNEVDILTNMNPEMKKKLGSQMTNEQRADMARLTELESQADVRGRGTARFRDPMKQAEYDRLKRQVRSRQETMDETDLSFQGMTETEAQMEKVRKKKAAREDERGIMNNIWQDMKAAFTGKHVDDDLVKQQIILQQELLKEQRKANATNKNIEKNTGKPKGLPSGTAEGN